MPSRCSTFSGTPTEDIYLLATWRGFGGSPLSEVRVYFRDEVPTRIRIRWIKLGYFIYEKTSPAA